MTYTKFIIVQTEKSNKSGLLSSLTIVPVMETSC